MFLNIPGSSPPWWRRAQPADVWSSIVVGLNIAYLFMPLVHHLFFSTDGGSWLDLNYSSYITSADNYFSRSAWVQICVWLVVVLMALGFGRLRGWLAGRRECPSNETNT